MPQPAKSRKASKPLNIATINIDSIHTNGKYLEHLAAQHPVLCIQEHMLYRFEVNTMFELLPNHSVHIKCFDDDDPIPPSHRPQGRAGVAIVWQKEYNNAVTVLPDGGNRVIAIQMDIAESNEKMTIISSYMPTIGTHDKTTDYQAVLDEVWAITEKYKTYGPIIWAGDMNASFRRKKKSKNDKLFLEHCEENGFVMPVTFPSQPTYHHFIGDIATQIDYILELKDCSSIINAVTIDERSPINCGAHDAVIAYLNIHSATTREQNKKKMCSIYKVKWSEVDIAKYRELTDENLKIMMKVGGDNMHPDILIDRMISILTDACIESGAVPSSIKVKKNRKNNWFRELKPFLAASKKSHWEWKNDPSQKKLQELKQSKKKLRSAQRCMSASKRDTLFEDIMRAETFDKNLMFKLINKQRKAQRSDQPIDFGKPNVDAEDGWVEYFKALSTPNDEEQFDSDFQQATELALLLIPDSLEAFGSTVDPISESTIKSHLKSLKNGKAPDTYNLTAEHLKNATPYITNVLTKLTNDIFLRKKWPDKFKLGVITPVPKKGKNPKLPDSHRRITVSAIASKIVEKEMVNKTEENKIGSDLQFGFIEGSSSTNCAFVISEAIAEAKCHNQPLYLTLLDARKAFDTVWHPSMLVSLFDDGIDSPLWDLFKDMYTDIRSVVKINGSLSQEFTEEQGIRQGASSSSGIFRRRGTKFIDKVASLKESFRIGTIEVGSPTCADDTMMISTSRMGAQLQINLAEYDANCHRYQFSDKKTKVVLMNAKASSEPKPLTLNGNNIDYSKEEKHLGIQRADDGKNKSTLNERVKTGRRATYSLMGAGLHGLNGCGVKTCLQLYRIYTIPAMLHNLDALIIEDSEFKEIEDFHKMFLRQIQHLPTSTATPALYLLTGELPVIAQMHIRILNLFVRLLRREMVEKNIIIRQLAMKRIQDKSWVTTVRKLLWKYQLPSAYHIVDSLPTKESWKKQVLSAVHIHWLSKLRQEAGDFTTLKYINVNACTIGKVHPVWAIKTDPQQVELATVKAKLLVQRYPLYGLSCAGKNKSNKCPLCNGDAETLPHFLLYCPSLEEQRMPLLSKITNLLQLCEPLNEDIWMQIILDASGMGLDEVTFKMIEIITRKLCFVLHHERAVRLGGSSTYSVARKRREDSICV